jgi:hypothetical protein
MILRSKRGLHWKRCAVNKLTTLLLETGLLQFGWFEPGGVPIRLNLEMLPAYPDVLREFIALAKPYTTNIHRLISVHAALPLGVGLSLETNIPLVYSRGTANSATYDLVGAYDIGHPALLLVNTLDDTPNIIDFVISARSVGLQIQHILAIVKTNATPMPDGITGHSLFDLHNAITQLMNDNRIPARHGEAILDWLEL